MDEMDQVMQREMDTTVANQKVVVREVVMKDLRAFTKACAPFLAEFDEAGALANRRGPSGEELPPDEFALFKVISEHADAMMLATSLVSNAPLAFLERLKPDEFFKVAKLVIMVNGNFFVQRLAPQLIAFARAMSLVGSMLSNPSSEPDTATTR